MRRQFGGIFVSAVVYAVDVRHDKRSARIGISGRQQALCVVLVVFPRDPLIGVHARYVAGKPIVHGIDCGPPVTVVPPVIQSFREYPLKVGRPVEYLIGLQQVRVVQRGFRMVVEHEGDALLMRFLRKQLESGEVRAADGVACSAVRHLLTPVGVDDQHVQGITAVVIVLYLLPRGILRVFIITGIPVSQQVKGDHLRFAGKINKVLCESLIVAVRQEYEYILSLVVKVPAVVFCGVKSVRIACFRGDDARRIGEIPAFQFIRGGGQHHFAGRVCLKTPELFTVRRRDAAARRILRPQRHVYRVIPGRDNSEAFGNGVGELDLVPARAFRDREGWTVFKTLRPFCLYTDKAAAEQLHPHAAFDNVGWQLVRIFCRVVFYFRVQPEKQCEQREEHAKKRADLCHFLPPWRSLRVESEGWRVEFRSATFPQAVTNQPSIHGSACQRHRPSWPSLSRS